MKKSDEVKVELWSIEICDSVMDMVHGNTYSIQEFYIPKYNITFNCITGKGTHIFDTPKSRYAPRSEERAGGGGRDPEKLKELTMPDSFARELRNYVDNTQDIEEKVKDFVSKFKPGED